MKYMYAILGGTGHIGTALAQQLLDRTKSILIIGHSADKRKEWKDKGAAYELADVLDSEKIGHFFAQAERLFILNPPADPAGDAEQTELAQVQSIGYALKGLTPKKIVMASTYGARDEKNIFDLGTLYQLEQILKAQGSP
ncbi:MAG: NAD-dependent epimerase/dehydratase family protein, partial [Pedobacter sp.]